MSERSRIAGISKARLAGAGFAAVAVAAVVVACASTPDVNQVTNIYTSPNAFSDFAGTGQTNSVPNSGVQGFLAAKCATLDCHGSIGRPFRLFSQNGLRLVDDAGNVSGGTGPTTQAEVYANYISAIGVQPELTSKVFYGLQDPHTLLLLRKPLQLERHKGGEVLQSGDPGDLCLTSWLEDGLQNANGVPLTIDNVSCNKAAALP